MTISLFTFTLQTKTNQISFLYVSHHAGKKVPVIYRLTFSVNLEVKFRIMSDRDQFCCYVAISKIRKWLLFRHTVFVLFCLFKTVIEFVNILTFLLFRLLYVCVLWFYTTWWQHVVNIAKVICSKSGFKKLNNFSFTKLLNLGLSWSWIIICGLPPQTTTTADYTYV